MLIVGLTGASGSGKTYLLSLIACDDICIIDTDKIYHSMIDHPSECTTELIYAFGQEIQDGSGGINRKALGTIVFSDKEKLTLLNKITHSFILTKCREIINECKKPIVIIDAPLLFESGFDKECDVTFGVVSTEELRVARMIERDNITYDKAYARLNSQKSDSWFREHCDFVIENSDRDADSVARLLKAEIMRLYGEKLEEKKKK